MSDIIGVFYFKQTDSGNLIGEFTNNKMLGVSTESADIKICKKNKFIGDYNTTWHEEDKVQKLNLEIKFKRDTNDLIYQLIWRDNKNKQKFEGIGFITENKLIGYYKDI